MLKIKENLYELIYDLYFYHLMLDSFNLGILVASDWI